MRKDITLFFVIGFGLVLQITALIWNVNYIIKDYDRFTQNMTYESQEKDFARCVDVCGDAKNIEKLDFQNRSISCTCHREEQPTIHFPSVTEVPLSVGN